jgi:hypothetical protein
MARLTALGKHHRVRQELNLSIQQTGRLQRVHQPGLIAKIVLVLGFRQRDRKRLQIVIAQHECRHFFGHIDKQRVAVLARQFAGRFRRAKCDLDVDLKVGGVHACRIVDGVSIESHAV